MAIFKVEPKSKQHDLLEKLIYIGNPQASPVGLCHTSFLSDKYAFDEIILIKNIHKSPTNNTLAGRQFFDYELSLPENESARLNDFFICLKEVTEFISNFNGECYQTISYIHTNTDNLHAHILMNNIDMLRGKRFNLSSVQLYKMKEGISNILLNHSFEPILIGSHGDL